MIEYSEQYIINEYHQRENKETFFGSPIWNEDGPESIGSVITMKRQVYSSRTTYGRGKLILLSLENKQEIDLEGQSIFSLEIPEEFPIKSLDSLLETVKPLNSSVKLDLALTNGNLRVALVEDLFLASETDHMFLLYAALEVWLQLNDLTTEEFCEQAELTERLEDIEDFLENPQDQSTWIDFNLGFDIELFLCS